MEYNVAGYCLNSQQSWSRKVELATSVLVKKLSIFPTLFGDI